MIYSIDVKELQSIEWTIKRLRLILYIILLQIRLNDINQRHKIWRYV
jgi:hypothetical protein